MSTKSQVTSLRTLVPYDWHDGGECYLSFEEKACAARDPCETESCAAKDACTAQDKCKVESGHCNCPVDIPLDRLSLQHQCKSAFTFIHRRECDHCDFTNIYEDSGVISSEPRDECIFVFEITDHDGSCHGALSSGRIGGGNQRGEIFYSGPIFISFESIRGFDDIVLKALFPDSTTSLTNDSAAGGAVTETASHLVPLSLLDISTLIAHYAAQGHLCIGLGPTDFYANIASRRWNYNDEDEDEQE